MNILNKPPTLYPRLHYSDIEVSSNILDLAGTAEEMHGQRLKTIFQNRSKAFMRLSLGKTVVWYFFPVEPLCQVS